MNNTTSSAKIIFHFAAAVPFLILNLYLLHSPTNADFTDTYTVEGTLAASAENWIHEDLAQEALMDVEKEGPIDSSDDQEVQTEAEKDESEANKEEPEQEDKAGKGREDNSADAPGSEAESEEIAESQGETEPEKNLESEDSVGSEIDDMEDVD